MMNNASQGFLNAIKKESLWKRNFIFFDYLII